jgi:hypothetical protein
MRGNKYKISKKRRLRRRGKYSKKLKPKSRKCGGWSFLGHKKNNVTIHATCDIPEFLFDTHKLFWTILVSSHPSKMKVIPKFFDSGKIDISFAGVLLEKNKTAYDRYTLSVELNTAVIDEAFFNNVHQVNPKTQFTINVPLIDFAVKKKGSYKNYEIYYSDYEPLKPLSFTCKDTNDEIMKSLLHLWRITYISGRDPEFPEFKPKSFDDFFKELSTPQYTEIVTKFRNHDYRFEVVGIQLSS